MLIRIGLFADQHLDYADSGPVDGQSGLNVRVTDGYRAFREAVTQMRAAALDHVVIAGDLTHTSTPSVLTIHTVRESLTGLPPVTICTGNHDKAERRGRLPAAMAFHDPSRGVDAVVDPVRLVRPAGLDGLTLTVLTHYGLTAGERIVPRPVDGEVNILVAHGAVTVPGHDVFNCVDSPGERPVGVDVVADPGWAAVMLGHYHGQGRLPDLNAWYAGSLLRRGWVDPPGDRGWLEFRIDDISGQVTEVVPHTIWQRPQWDLPVIEAAGMSAADVTAAILHNLEQVDTEGALVRQTVLGLTRPARAGLDRAGIGRATRGVHLWRLHTPSAKTRQLRDPAATPDGVPGSEPDTPGVDTGHLSRGLLPAAWQHWAPEWARTTGLPDSLHDPVRERGAIILNAAAGAAPDDERGDR